MSGHSNSTISARGIGVLALVCGGLFAGKAQSPATEISRMSDHREVSGQAEYLAAA